MGQSSSMLPACSSALTRNWYRAMTEGWKRCFLSVVFPSSYNWRRYSLSKFISIAHQLGSLCKGNAYFRYSTIKVEVFSPNSSAASVLIRSPIMKLYFPLREVTLQKNIATLPPSTENVWCTLCNPLMAECILLKTNAYCFTALRKRSLTFLQFISDRLIYT